MRFYQFKIEPPSNLQLFQIRKIRGFFGNILGKEPENEKCVNLKCNFIGDLAFPAETSSSAP